MKKIITMLTAMAILAGFCAVPAHAEESGIAPYALLTNDLTAP